MTRISAGATLTTRALLAAGLALPAAALGQAGTNPNANADAAALLARADIAGLPTPVQAVLVQMARDPHTFLPQPAFAEGAASAPLLAYATMDSTGFQRNTFTFQFNGVNNTALPTATGANGLASMGAVRVVLEPRSGAPAVATDPAAFADIFLDVSNIFPVNNESGWYEGWMISDLRVAPTQTAGAGGAAAFGTITPADATALARMGTNNTVAGNVFTTNGQAPALPSSSNRFPLTQTNVVSVYVSTGTFNALQQGDAHSYHDFNPTTNWSFPLYEEPTSGGAIGVFGAGKVGTVSSVIPGAGPSAGNFVNGTSTGNGNNRNGNNGNNGNNGTITINTNNPVTFGDSPHIPRDPDRTAATDPNQIETRVRNIPSGLAREILLDVYQRTASFEPNVTGAQRFYDAYAAEVSRVDQDRNGIVDSEEAMIGATTNGAANTRLYIPLSQFDRFAVTREINDGLLGPRFVPSQRAWILSGTITPTTGNTISATAGEDADGR